MIQPVPSEDNLNNNTKPEGENSLRDGGRNIHMDRGNYNERIEGDYIQGDRVNNYYTGMPSTPETTGLSKKNPSSNLSGSQRKQFQEALMDAFPSKSLLEQMLSFELDKNLDVIASGGNLSQIVFELITKAEAQNWVEDLINAARRANPGNNSLKVVAQSFTRKTSEKEILEIEQPIVVQKESEYSNEKEGDKRQIVLTQGVRKSWAIVIGINEYDNLQGLKYAQGDAEAMAGWFKDEAGFDKVFVFTNNSPPIYEANSPIPTKPTFGHVRRFLRVQFEDTERSLLRAGDNLWFFFAGHGKRYRDKDYLMLSDSDPGDLEYTAISVDYVTQRLRRSGADNVVLVLDACRDESSRSRGELGIGNEKHQGVITFYSCNANQQSWEIEELGHGIFTHVLLKGLRLQGERNCATVERLDQYLQYYVPQMNVRYGKPRQNPYLKAEPPYKMYFILLESSVTLKDIESLKYQASLAENQGNLVLAEELWIRVLAVSRGDLDAIGAIQRIAVKKTTKRQEKIVETVIPISEGGTSLRGEGVEIYQSETQKQEKHEKNLAEYKQSFSQALEEEFPLSEGSRSRLRNLQESLRTSEKEVLEIEQPIVARKEAEYLQLQKEERIREQQEAQKRKQDEAHRRRQQQAQTTTTRSSTLISRKQFLKWAGLGGGGLAIAVIVSGIFKGLLVAQPKYIPPNEGGRKAFGLPLWTVEFETIKVDRRGEILERYPNKEAKFFKEDLGNGVSLEMLEIPSGSLKMGSLPEEKGSRDNERPQHEVRVGSFFMGKYQVTQAQWRAVASLPPVKRRLEAEPSRFKGDNRPVETVSWYDAVEFCSRLSEHTGREYCLPSEAQWEYACRAGTTTPFHFGETITSELANYDGSIFYANEPKGQYLKETTPVGQFPANAFGLYDMHGNVWEWCFDDWHDNYEGAPTDGSPWVNNENDNSSQGKVRRGGSWDNDPQDCRSGFRYKDLSNYRDYRGFRLVCCRVSN